MDAEDVLFQCKLLVQRHIPKSMEIWTKVGKVITAVHQKLGHEEVGRRKEPEKDMDVSKSFR